MHRAPSRPGRLRPVPAALLPRHIACAAAAGARRLHGRPAAANAAALPPLRRRRGVRPEAPAGAGCERRRRGGGAAARGGRVRGCHVWHATGRVGTERCQAMPGRNAVRGRLCVWGPCVSRSVHACETGVASLCGNHSAGGRRSNLWPNFCLEEGGPVSPPWTPGPPPERFTYPGCQLLQPDRQRVRAAAAHAEGKKQKNSPPRARKQHHLQEERTMLCGRSRPASP